jgi:type II secretory pathway pseudopilin PulG
MQRNTKNVSLQRSGFTLVELSIAGVIMAAVLFGIASVCFRDDDTTRSSLAVGIAESRAQQMLSSLERELAPAHAKSPHGVLTLPLGASDTGSARVDTTLGFPDRGLLLVDRGNGNVERLRYSGLESTHTLFLQLARADQCTIAANHALGADVMWAGLAEPIALQVNPPAATWDGRAKESTGPVYFRGDGSGFSYRLPTDPSGGTQVMSDGDVRWGAQVDGTPSLAGWAALWFEPRETYDESLYHHDINGDGDTNDVFDVGQIKKRTWDTDVPSAAVHELGLGPTVVIQERCKWGRDLDGDGFDDPIFLWDATTHCLHVRLHVLGTTLANVPITRMVESTIYLRNEPDI